MKKNILIVASLLLSLPVLAANQGSVSGRVTAALGEHPMRAPYSHLASLDAGCELVVKEVDPYRQAVSVSLSQNSRSVSFMGLDWQLTEAVVDVDVVQATSVYNDGAGRAITRKLSITNLPATGLSGSTVTITEDGVTKSCRF